MALFSSLQERVFFLVTWWKNIPNFAENRKLPPKVVFIAVRSFRTVKWGEKLLKNVQMLSPWRESCAQTSTHPYHRFAMNVGTLCLVNVLGTSDAVAVVKQNKGASDQRSGWETIGKLHLATDCTQQITVSHKQGNKHLTQATLRCFHIEVFGPVLSIHMMLSNNSSLLTFSPPLL